MSYVWQRERRENGEQFGCFPEKIAEFKAK